MLDSSGGAANWDQRLSAALKRLAVRSGLYVAVASIWFVSGFVLTPLGPGLLYQPSHLLLEKPPADASRLLADQDLSAADYGRIELLTGRLPVLGRIRVWAGTDGTPAYYAMLLEFPSEHDATQALGNAAQGPGGLLGAMSLGEGDPGFQGDVLNPPAAQSDQRLPGLSMTFGGAGPVYVQRSGYVFLLDDEDPGRGQQEQQDALARWRRQQEDRVPFSSTLGLVLPGWVHTPAAVSGWFAVVIAWYVALSNLTAPLRYWIARLRRFQSPLSAPHAALPPVPLPQQPAHLIDVEDQVRRRRIPAAGGAAVRGVGYLLVLLAALRWWWSIGRIPMAPFALSAALVLVYLGDRVAGSRRQRASYVRMVKTARAKDRVFAALWVVFAILTLLFALTWSPGMTDSTTHISSGTGETPSTSGGNTDFSWPGLVLLPVVAWALRRGRYRVELTAGQAVVADLRPPILYLRSFADDRLIVRSHASSRQGALARYTYRRWEPFEEVVAWHVWTYGPLVAAAEPGARRRPLGAAREELDDSVDAVWRARITELVEEAALVVVLVGPTAGLAWELECLHRLGRLDRTVFLLPPVSQRSNAERWETARRTFDSLGIRLPRLPRGAGEVLAAAVLSDVVVFATARHHSDWSYQAAVEILVENIRRPTGARADQLPEYPGGCDPENPEGLSVA